MIERELGIGGRDRSVKHRLDVACALVHALVSQAPGDRSTGMEELALLEELTLPIAVFDAAGRAPVLTNAAWRASLGARGEAALGPHVDEAIRTGATAHLPELALAPDGPPACCAATLRPLRNRAGATTSVIVLCAMITDEVVARELAVSADALVCGGPRSRGPDYVNRAWRAYTGAPAEPADTHAWQDVLSAGDLARCMQAVRKTARGGSPELEVQMRRADGAARWHRIRFVSAAAQPRWFGIATDIDDARIEAERAESLAREHRALADAERASRLRDQFLAAVSHELRAPLSALLLWEKVLRDETADAALRAQALEAIHQSAVAQSRLVNDLLDISRAINGKLHLDLRPLDIERVLREALEALAPAARAKQISLEHRGTWTATEIQGDGARLRQVLDNLLGNAVKFTGPGGRITVEIARGDRAISIDIEDNGRGIAPESLPHLFEPFTQLDDSLTRVTGGLGLGLSIAKQIVMLHHGELTARSAGPGRGATFTVRLPIHARRSRTQTDDLPHRPTLAGQIRILVIDDDRRVRSALALLLEGAGAVVDTAESAESARARIARRPPDVLVCDIAMPDEDGHTFIRGLRASGQAFPAIALTAHAMEADARRALAAGFDLHLAKPVDFERLVEKIDALVAARRASARP
jgi:signal transduction histidine kinase/CheY-like chemotaxis protein